jgi:hypothetical protein
MQDHSVRIDCLRLAHAVVGNSPPAILGTAEMFLRFVETGRVQQVSPSNGQFGQNATDTSVP